MAEELPPLTQKNMQWLPESGTEHTTKTQRVGATNQEDLMDQLNNRKLEAQLAQQIRTVMSACLWTALLPIAMIQPALDAAKSHADRTRGVSGHSLGPPHPHIWKAMLETIVASAKEFHAKTPSKVIEDYRSPLLKYMEAVMTNPANHMWFIKICKAKELTDKKGLISWQLSTLYEESVKVDQSLMKSFEVRGADIRSGQAPAGPLERNVQAQIDTLNSRLGKGGGKGKGDK